ncbi:hypothetical protein LCGC14_0245810 [marine sediment metagenome]|uniref:Uncharacterized protein n=1 Tax=marine sediment metagenome TaxID=412755 RepID=A0A0F9U649_9ZZZZ
MCDLTENISKSIVFGYKIAVKIIKDNGEIEYRSLATRIAYKKGNVEVPDQSKNITAYLCFAPDLHRPTSPAYVPSLVGRTSVFVILSDAICLGSNLPSYLGKNQDRLSLVVIKLGLKDDLMQGCYASSPVYAGRRITSVKEIEEIRY